MARRKTYNNKLLYRSILSVLLILSYLHCLTTRPQVVIAILVLIAGTVPQTMRTACLP